MIEKVVKLAEQGWDSNRIAAQLSIHKQDVDKIISGNTDEPLWYDQKKMDVAADVIKTVDPKKIKKLKK